MFFHDIIYYLTATQTLTFGHIKYTPDVALAGSFLYIAFGQYFRRRMGEKLPPKMQNESFVDSFYWKSCPWCHVFFLTNERLEC